jgi:ATP-dependent RNA helicase RhlE
VSQSNWPRFALPMDIVVGAADVSAATRKNKQLTTFSDLGLAAPILEAVTAEGYTEPTPIQAQAIPSILAGRDLLGIARTGTGKTAAFALPIIHRLASDRRRTAHKGCRVLVLSPTRELASQIAQSFRAYGRHLDLTVAVVFGGVGHRPQTQALARGVDVLVATPGRLLDHMAERNISLAGTEILVLDEADRMLDLGFLPPIRRIVSHLPRKRQNLFFSATMPHEIGRLAAELLADPVRIAVSPVASTVDSVTQRVLHVESHNKRSLLVELFADPQMSRALVFTRTKRGADRVARHLEAAGIRVAAIHGNKSQSQREHALAAFRASKIRVLVATDIAARGIDIDDVTHVVNYELPDVPESYVHRIGRTARAGAAGMAISLCATDERDLLREIERLTRQAIPSEDRRLEGARLPARPAHGELDRRHAGGPPASRPADERGGPARGRQQRPPRGRQWHGEKDGPAGVRSSSGPARRRRPQAERRQDRIA